MTEQWHLEASEVDGANNIINTLVRRFPLITWVLVSSGFNIKKNCSCDG
jgi:hypothetical protein